MSDVESTTNGHRGWWRDTTPQQIKNLLEKGKTAEEIAELLGTTVGSLKVRCSQHHVSLRRPADILRQPPVEQKPPQPVSTITVQGITIKADDGLQTLEMGLKRQLEHLVKEVEAVKNQLIGVQLARKALT